MEQNLTAGSWMKALKQRRGPSNTKWRSVSAEKPSFRKRRGSKCLGLVWEGNFSVGKEREGGLSDLGEEPYPPVGKGGRAV